MALAKREVASADFIKILDGKNKVRIVSEFKDYWVHFDAENKSTHKCVGKGSCQWCASENPRTAKAKHIFACLGINRLDQLKAQEAKGDTTAVPKLLEIGGSTYDQLVALSETDEWGFDTVPAYDIIISKSGTGLGTEYNVSPVPHAALRPQDAEAVKKCLAAGGIGLAVSKRFEPKGDTLPKPEDDDEPEQRKFNQAAANVAAGTAAKTAVGEEEINISEIPF